MINWIYVRYRTVCFFFSIVFRRWTPETARFMPRETWDLGWDLWKDWDSTRYRRTWKP